MQAAAAPGEVIDARYTIIRMIGRGAMADVFEARDAITSDKVAIKILRSVIAQDPESVARFQREAQVQARIRHPNVAVLHGVGLHRGTPYLAMELLTGRSLLSVIKYEKRVPLMRAAAYGWQSLQGLSATHAAGVLHRDLKPANLMLQPSGPNAERVVLIDFGFAALEGSAGITRQGFVVGSLTYMAPERLRSEPVDARSDLYAIAVVLYELLAGFPPFRSDDDASLIAQVLDEPAQSLRALGHDEVPEALDALILSALAKHANERPATASEMAQRLAAAVGVK